MKSLSLILLVFSLSLNFAQQPQGKGGGKGVGKPKIGIISGKIINENKTGFLIEPGNINQLKEKINLLHKDINLAKEMGKAAAENAYNRWHPFKVAEKTLKAYTLAITKGN